jgi:hypothetical protein
MNAPDRATNSRRHIDEPITRSNPAPDIKPLGARHPPISVLARHPSTSSSDQFRRLLLAEMMRWSLETELKTTPMTLELHGLCTRRLNATLGCTR